MKIKRAEITVETKEVLIIRANTGSPIRLCEQCGARMLRTEEVVMLAGVSARAIHRLIEAGLIHFAETREGLALICIGSLEQNITNAG